MFVNVLFPLADVRPFVEEDTHRLLAPSWPDPVPERGEFSRYLGSARHRPRGGISDWDSEETFVTARRALRIAGMAPRKTAPFRCVFRRLFFDNRALARVSAGFVPDAELPIQRARDILLDVPASVPDPLAERADPAKASRRSQPLAEAGGALASLFLASTTHHAHLALARERHWWVTAGSPVMVIEAPRGLTPGIADEQTWVEHSPDVRAVLSHRWLTRDRARIRVWTILFDPDVELDRARRMRINLMRLHAEQECLRVVLRLLATERIKAVRGTSQSDALQMFLNDALRVLSKKERNGVPNSAIFEQASHYEQAVNEDSQGALQRQLQTMRTQVVRKIQTFVHQPADAADRFQIHIHETHIERVETMNNIEIGGDNYGNVVIANEIKDSFNQARSGLGLVASLTSAFRFLDAFAAASGSDRGTAGQRDEGGARVVDEAGTK